MSSDFGSTHLRQSLKFFRGSQYDSLEQEFDEIRSARQEKDIHVATGWKEKMKVLTSRSFLKPFVCVGAITILHRLEFLPVITMNLIILLSPVLQVT